MIARLLPALMMAVWPCLAALNAPGAIKMVLVGASGVGKTCLAERWIYGRPPATFMDLPTIGAAYHKKVFTFPDTAATMTVNLWDTAGQERFSGLMPMYVRGAHVIAVVYDVSQVKSYAESVGMFERLKEHISNEQVLLILIGSKCDLLKDLSSLTANMEDEEESEWRRLGFKKHYIVSAFATDAGFEVAVADLVDVIRANYETLMADSRSINNNTHHLQSVNNNPKKGKCCLSN